MEIEKKAENQAATAPEVPKARTDEHSRLTSDVFNRNTTVRHYVNEVHFTFHNHHLIKDMIESGRAIDLVDLPKRKGKSVMIIGSGPTLDDAIAFLDEWEGDIICSTSQATTLLAAGIVPDYIVALDPDSNPEELKTPSTVKWEDTKARLVFHPGVCTDLVEWWPGKVALFRKLQPQQTFYAGEQATGYSGLGPKEGARYIGEKADLWIKAQIPVLACAVPAQICVAKHLGYRQQVLVGCDFSMPGDQARFTGVSISADGTAWVPGKPPPIEFDSESEDSIVETEYGVKSTTMQIFYSKQAMIAWRIVEGDIINSSNQGILRMFPYHPIHEIVKRGNKGVKGFNRKQIMRVSEEHLAKQNIYFIKVGTDAWIPQEFSDPMHDIPKMMKDAKRTLAAKGQGDDLDIEANMKRFRKLFDIVLKNAT